MPVTSVIGLQWGDEAKGKIVDLLTPQHEIVVRYQGGANAGHTVVVGGETFKMSLLPSGILTDGVTSVVAGGVVLSPAKLLEELDELKARGIDASGRLMISDRAHVIFPWHLLEDQALESGADPGERLGTTQRGIGPCYRDKVGRAHALRLGDMLRPSFPERFAQLLAIKTRLLAGLYGNEVADRLDGPAIFQAYQGFAERLRPFVADTTDYLLSAAESGRRILLEGAQGTLLDVDHGTYPFVTSSNSSGVGASNGTGIPGCFMTHVIGVMKAYSTRVGEGPFPTELDNEIGGHIRERGREYGTVTRRPRRCGWADAVALRYAVRLGGVNSLCVMLLDVLSELPELKICTAYEIDGKRIERFPSHADDLRRAVPVWETLPGWQRDIASVERFEQLPPEARAYLDRISQLVQCKVRVISVGPDRKQTIFVPPWPMEPVAAA